ncbi:hypothetical protein E2C01_077336 [Portunus trituberculatus]|uniref:Uncharacterized protein n=1 Tax=Portunus trituberculatus TaxID=210409 RepID=A0A5B7IL56_PORTR|nr:hypothetical protein [Portunus trituberculatus]
MGKKGSKEVTRRPPVEGHCEAPLHPRAFPTTPEDTPTLPKHRRKLLHCQRRRLHCPPTLRQIFLIALHYHHHYHHFQHHHRHYRSKLTPARPFLISIIEYAASNLHLQPPMQPPSHPNTHTQRRLSQAASRVLYCCCRLLPPILH